MQQAPSERDADPVPMGAHPGEGGSPVPVGGAGRPVDCRVQACSCSSGSRRSVDGAVIIPEELDVHNQATDGTISIVPMTSPTLHSHRGRTRTLRKK